MYKENEQPMKTTKDDQTRDPHSGLYDQVSICPWDLSLTKFKILSKSSGMEILMEDDKGLVQAT